MWLNSNQNPQLILGKQRYKINYNINRPTQKRLGGFFTMDYFQELLSSYQKIKKRTFRVGYIVEQQQDPMSAYNDAASQAQGLVSQGVVSISNGPKLGVNGVITAYTSKVKGGIVPGLAMSNGSTPIPGSQNYAVRLSTLANNPEAQKKIGEILLGQKTDSQEQETPKGEETPQAEVNAQVEITPEQQAQAAFQQYLNLSNQDVASLINTGFFSSIEKIVPKWMRDASELKKHFTGERWSLESKFKNGKDQQDTPISLEQQLEAAATFSKFISIVKKLHEGTITELDMSWVKDHISTGSTSEDKRSIRIKSDASNTAVSFKWTKGKGVGKDMQLWRHLIDSYDEKISEWATRQVPERNAEELKIPRDRFTLGTASTGQLAAIQGFFSEDFVEIGILLREASKLSQSDPTRAGNYRRQAMKLFETSYNKNKEGLLKAFNVYEAFLQGNIVVTDEALSELGDFADIAKELNIGIRDAALVGLTPEQKAVLADTFTMEAAKALIQLDSQFAYKLDADFVVRLGTNKRNGKKTDLVYIFNTKEEAISGLKRQGLSDKDINQFIISSKEAQTLFQDPELNKFLSRAGPEAFVVPVGIKTYSKAKGVKLGTASFSSVIKTLSGKIVDPDLIGQSTAIIKKLKTIHAPTAYSGHIRNMETLSDVSKYMDKLLLDEDKETIPKSTLKIIKEVLAEKSAKEADAFLERLSAYESSPEDNLDFKYEVNKYIEEEKRSRILNAISSGLRGSNKESWLCTLEAFTMATASAAEKNQLTVSRFIQGRESRVMDHNSSYEQIFDGVRKGFIGVVAEGGSLKFVCKGKSRLCDADHYGSLSMSEGRFNFELNLASVRRLDSELIQSVVESFTNSDILNLLLEQRNLINTLLSKYQ